MRKSHFWTAPNVWGHPLSHVKVYDISGVKAFRFGRVPIEGPFYPAVVKTHQEVPEARVVWNVPCTPPPLTVDVRTYPLADVAIVKPIEGVDETEVWHRNVEHQLHCLRPI